MDRPHALHPARMLALAGFFMLLAQPPRLATLLRLQVATLTATTSFTPAPSLASSQTATGTGTATPSAAPASPTPTSAATTSQSPTGSPTASASGTATAASPSVTSSPAPPTHAAPGSVLINEVAWAGTGASPQDEWIELHNPSPTDISLSGWRLSDDGDINIQLNGLLPAFGFYLLERTNDSTVASLPANQIYTGALVNSGETLTLFDGSGHIIDSANQAGGAWPAGSAATRSSMERLGGGDLPGNWVTFDGITNAVDADGQPILGSPLAPTSAFAATATPSGTPPTSATASPTSLPPGAVLINEVAWAGTLASFSHEWMELHNTTAQPIDLQGWHLTDGGDINIDLAGTLSPHGFGLLERGSDNVVADVTALQLYSGNLRNSGETLTLFDPHGRLMDRGNGSGGGWPGGEAGSRRSMERRDSGDRRSSWASFTGFHGNGSDATGHPIAGTPGRQNSLLFPTPTPTWIPGQLVINEVLIRPHYDWEGVGGVSTDDEFIEIYNRGPNPVWLRGWMLDDVSGSGSRPYALPGITVDPGDVVAFFRSHTHIALNDSGDSVRLLAPDGRMIDKIQYLAVRAYNLSYGRLPDGSNQLVYGLWPTPNEANLLFVEPDTPDHGRLPLDPYACAPGERPRPALPRLGRTGPAARWWLSLGLLWCVPAS